MINRSNTYAVIFYKKLITSSCITISYLNFWLRLIPHKFHSIREKVFKYLGKPVSVTHYLWNIVRNYKFSPFFRKSRSYIFKDTRNNFTDVCNRKVTYYLTKPRYL